MPGEKEPKEEKPFTWKDHAQTLLYMFVGVPCTMFLVQIAFLFPYETWRGPINSFAEHHPIWAHMISFLMLFVAIFVLLAWREISADANKRFKKE